MGQRAKAGTCLASLVKMAVPLCPRDERECPPTGPGRKPEIPDWVLAVLMMVAVQKRRKSKSAQYRFLCPENKRGSEPQSRKKTVPPRDASHRRPLARQKFYRSRRGKAIYRRRGGRPLIACPLQVR